MQKLRSKIIGTIKAKTFFKAIHYQLNKGRMLKKLNALDYEKWVCKWRMNYAFDFEHPRSFNEKIVFLKMFYRNDLWKDCADKLKAKEILTSWGFGKYLPKTYGIFKSAKEIKIEKLPDTFVLKTNNDSGSVFVCTKTEDLSQKLEKLERSLNNSSFKLKTNEWVYSCEEPRIFAEERLEPQDGAKELNDYKFFTFGGKIKAIKSYSKRNVDVKAFFADENFNEIANMVSDYYDIPKPKDRAPKPKDFELMKEIVEGVAKHFDWCRVDMYSTKSGPKIGEITFFPASGHGPFQNKRDDFTFGKLFEESPLEALFEEARSKKP